MSAAELLVDLSSRGITLETDGGTLRYYAAEGALTPVLRERIKTHKLELLAYLAKDAANTIADPVETQTVQTSHITREEHRSLIADPIAGCTACGSGQWWQLPSESWRCANVGR